jgi:hypothetical protein
VCRTSNLFFLDVHVEREHVVLIQRGGINVMLVLSSSMRIMALFDRLFFFIYKSDVADLL